MLLSRPSARPAGRGRHATTPLRRRGGPSGRVAPGPLRAAAPAATAEAEALSPPVPRTPSPPLPSSPPSITVRLLSAVDEAEADSVGALRAEAYYEDQPGGGGRFATSYKKQFREQEARSLRTRTAPARGGGPPECVCLVAVDGGDGAGPSPPIAGALDIRPPASAGGPHPKGVPAGDAAAVAVLNVAVSPPSRRRGVGAALMAAAASFAASEWGASRLYTSVAAANTPARALYAACGYEAVEDDGECGVGIALTGTTSLGREILLCADVQEV